MVTLPDIRLRSEDIEDIAYQTVFVGCDEKSPLRLIAGILGGTVSDWSIHMNDGRLILSSWGVK